MLTYEHVSRSEIDRDTIEFASRVVESGSACRVTTTYVSSGFVPDIKYFYKNDYHRTDGPAVIELDMDDVAGYIDFWVNGSVYYSTKQYCEAAGMSDEDTFMWVLRFGDDLPQTAAEFYGENWKSIPMDQL